MGSSQAAAQDMEDETKGSFMNVMPPGKVLFRAQLFWQQLLPEHVAQAGLDFRLGITENGTDGNNYARLQSGEDIAEDSPYALSTAVVVDEGANDEAAVSKLLRQRATWGDASQIRKLLSSCYCTKQSTIGALTEAAFRGHKDVVEVLLNAGAPIDGVQHGKTALHIACEEGHEDIARMLIERCGSRETALMTTPGGLSALDLARQSDLGGVARRMQALIDELYPAAKVGGDAEESVVTEKTGATEVAEEAGLKGNV
mmetsp:Transcript_18901/g.44299  ORF Transcript_18901/g.44299 Transcript_18901/m.44299 type:complete len:257 (-) Transcript_18901:105-875(-)|eukprot:CAMPEP_0114555922 /NCGR_PEP_ID=MMETSP0114-20121206/9006_1 /TAXON_ID=31324 /ORGANISM="Goniomonas sp, Strain m" /LENGTH=256 /DNA_ID=CAMNT_0001741077 /DNA_START=90 /DNA_END=860 /DNA_ORIENTATION=-